MAAVVPPAPIAFPDLKLPLQYRIDEKNAVVVIDGLGNSFHSPLAEMLNGVIQEAKFRGWFQSAIDNTPHYKLDGALEAKGNLSFTLTTEHAGVLGPFVLHRVNAGEVQMLQQAVGLLLARVQVLDNDLKNTRARLATAETELKNSAAAALVLERRLATAEADLKKLPPPVEFEKKSITVSFGAHARAGTYTAPLLDAQGPPAKHNINMGTKRKVLSAWIYPYSTAGGAPASWCHCYVEPDGGTGVDLIVKCGTQPNETAFWIVCAY